LYESPAAKAAGTIYSTLTSDIQHCPPAVLFSWFRAQYSEQAVHGKNAKRFY